MRGLDLGFGLCDNNEYSAQSFAALAADAISIGNYTRFPRSTASTSSIYRWHKKVYSVPQDGGGDATNFQFPWGLLRHGTGGENITDLDDTVLSEVYLENEAGDLAQITFAGQDSVTLTPVVTLSDIIFNDPVSTITEAEGGALKLYWKLAYSNGRYATGTVTIAANGEGVLASSNPNAHAGNPTSRNYTSGGDNNCLGPLGMFATRANRSRVAAILTEGNSQADGGSTMDSSGNASWLEYCANNKRSVCAAISVPSITSSTIANPAEFPITTAFFQSISHAFTHYVANMGGNTLTGSGTATLIANIESRFDIWRAEGLLCTAVTMFPSTESTDGWTTTGANQTPDADSTDRETYDGELEDYTLETDIAPITAPSLLRDATFTQQWGNASGTAWTDDGDHPNTVGKTKLKTDYNLDWIVPDIFASSTNIEQRYSARRSAKTYNTDKATGDVASLTSIQGTGTLVASSGNSPLYNNLAMSGMGALRASANTAFMTLGTALAAATPRSMLFIMKPAGSSPASRAYMATLGPDVAVGSTWAALTHETDGSMDIALKDTATNEQILASSNDISLYVFVDIKAENAVDVYVNSTTAVATNLVMNDLPTNNVRWWNSAYMQLFQRTDATAAEVGTDIAEVIMFDDALSGLDVSISDIDFYAKGIAQIS